MSASPPCLQPLDGRACLEVSVVSGQSTVTAASSTSPMKLLTPRSRGVSVWAYLSNYGGGLLAGDRTHLDVKIGPGARCFLSTQASTKVFRSRAGLPSSHRTSGILEKDAILVFAPDPVQPFAGSVYRQYQQWRLEEGAGLVLLDWFCSGRMARGEQWQFTRYQSRNDVHREGRRAFVDSVLLEDAELSEHAPHVVGGFHCFAMLLIIGTPVASAAADLLANVAARPIASGSATICSASPLHDGVVLRVAAKTTRGATLELESHLHALVRLLGDNPWKRKW